MSDSLTEFAVMASVNYQYQGLVNVKLKPCFSRVLYPAVTAACFRFSTLSINRNKVIVCGLRASFRKRPPSRVLSKEAIQVIQALKLAKPTHKLDQVLNSRLTRLLKVDVLDVLAELQRQNEIDLSLKVFNFIDEEPGYNTLLSLYSDMILFLGRNKMIDMAEELFSEVMKKGLKPDTRTYTEMIGAYMQVGMIDKAMEIYRLMKESGCVPDKLTFMILIRNLENAGEQELAATLKEECVEYVESPDKFIQEVEQKHAKKRSLNQA